MFDTITFYICKLQFMQTRKFTWSGSIYFGNLIIKLESFICKPERFWCADVSQNGSGWVWGCMSKCADSAGNWKSPKLDWIQMRETSDNELAAFVGSQPFWETFSKHPTRSSIKTRMIRYLSNPIDDRMVHEWAFEFLTIGWLFRSQIRTS